MQNEWDRQKALSLPTSFQFCAGSAADISPWWSVAQPRANVRYCCVCAPRGARDQTSRQAPGAIATRFLRPCQGARALRCCSGGCAPLHHRSAPPPANVHGPSRAKNGNRQMQKLWVKARQKAHPTLIESAWPLLLLRWCDGRLHVLFLRQRVPFRRLHVQ
jgi:hypothetical protein